MPTVFVISSQPRTGTYMLSTALDGHPAIRSYGELFTALARPDWDRSKEPAEDILREWQASLPGIQVAGFAVHHWVFKKEPMIAAAIARLRPRVLLLYRQELLEQFCSRLLALRTDLWLRLSESSAEPQRETLHVTAAEAESFFTQSVRDVSEDRRLWVQADCPVLELTYEYLVRSWDKAIAEAQEFLGVPWRPLQSKTLKLEHRAPWDILANYDELAAIMQGTRWGHLFAKPPRRH